jgi:hypothetical protein
VITYEGKLAEFLRYQSRGYYVVEIPETRRSRLIRGDWSACASKNGVTVWSFQNLPGTQAILRQLPGPDEGGGRIEITFAPDLQPLSPSLSPSDQVRKQELVKRIKDLPPGRAAELLKELGADPASDDKDARSRLKSMVIAAKSDDLTELEAKLNKGRRGSDISENRPRGAEPKQSPTPKLTESSPSPSPSDDQVRKQELVKRIKDLPPRRAAELLKELGADTASDDKDARSRLKSMVMAAKSDDLTELEAELPP